MKYNDDNEKFAIPFVSGIVEYREGNDVLILIQTRWKPSIDSKYSGLLELPGGKIREFEDVHKALKREVMEETGVKISKIYTERTKKVSLRKDSAFSFRSFCAQQQVKDGKPWIGFTFLCEAKSKKHILTGDDSKSVHWIKRSKLKKILDETPEKIFTIHASVLKMYFDSLE